MYRRGDVVVGGTGRFNAVICAQAVGYESGVCFWRLSSISISCRPFLPRVRIYISLRWRSLEGCSGPFRLRFNGTMRVPLETCSGGAVCAHKNWTDVRRRAYVTMETDVPVGLLVQIKRYDSIVGCRVCSINHLRPSPGRYIYNCAECAGPRRHSAVASSGLFERPLCAHTSVTNNKNIIL